MDKGKELINRHIELSEADFTGNGMHKKCYLYPGRPGYCVKVAYNEGGVKDLTREIKYLNTLKNKNRDYSVLPAYYGPVSTNRGPGYVYEYICNYDGKECLNILQILKDEDLLKKYYDIILKKVIELHDTLINNEIITMRLAASNILLQETAPEQYMIRLVNDMGSGSILPFSYHFSLFARRSIERRWKRFLNSLRRYCAEGLIASELGKKYVDELNKAFE